MHVCGYRDAPKNGLIINTTSRSTNWSRGLSPFFLGPVNLYLSYTAKNVENAWQFSKVYDVHVDENGNPTPEYFTWAVNGWADSYAHRYPMGKGVIPQYSYWDGEKLDYISARKKIYIPLYRKAVASTAAFAELKNISEKEDIWLWDFDGYNYEKIGMSLQDVANDKTRKMGHAFVLAMMLGEIHEEV